jgi:hypothetical protein
MLTSPQQAVTALLLALLVCGCAADNRTRTDAQFDATVASVNDFVAKSRADAEAKIADYDRRIETWKPQLRIYYGCNRNASKIVSTQAGDPTSLAIAARSVCRTEEANLQKAIYAAYTDDPRFGMDALEKARLKALENNTGDIVAARAVANPTPRSPAPQTAPPNKGNEI